MTHVTIQSGLYTHHLVVPNHTDSPQSAFHRSIAATYMPNSSNYFWTDAPPLLKDDVENLLNSMVEKKIQQDFEAQCQRLQEHDKCIKNCEEGLEDQLAKIEMMREILDENSSKKSERSHSLVWGSQYEMWTRSVFEMMMIRSPLHEAAWCSHSPY